ncbi:MAG: SpoIVB peptidase [Firmicutes bacterium]|nr:SpoIVB peptidase [Bacillota bacterium]
MRKGKACGLLGGLFLLLSASLPFMGFLAPGSYSVTAGEPFHFNFPFAVERNLIVYSGDGTNRLSERAGEGGTGMYVADKPGLYRLNVKLFGLIPIRDVIVNALPQVKVIPGGQSIGVLMHTQGILVVGSAEVVDNSGRKICPAADAGLKPGDIILRIDGVSVESEEEVREMVSRAGEAGLSVLVEYKRGQEIMASPINPVFCNEAGRYRIGLLIKDVTAGVGTITFYDPESKVYGALGHVITDGETSRPLEMTEGRIVGTVVQGINRGRRGQPGEKIGMFSHDGKINGLITKNSRLGIFGKLQQAAGLERLEPVPVAPIDQVHEGPAEIMTVLKGEQVDKFSVEIVRLNPNARSDGKGMIIKITDQRLIDETGGIVQGMSGSPILQDGKLAGAVTHVFVNDPTRGFGTFAEWMLWEAGIIPGETGQSMTGRSFF